MRFRDSITLHICPLLLRIGLAAAFLWAGIPKWGNETFEGPAAATLVELGIGHKTAVAGRASPTPPAGAKEPERPGSTPVVEPPAPQESPDSAQQPGEEPSSDTPPAIEEGADDQGEQDQPGEPSVEQPAPPTTTPPETKPAELVEKPDVGDAAGATVQYKVDAKKVEGITVMLHDVGHPYPRIFAWIAMLTETVGAGLLLIGLFSRVWGLGLAVAMGYAFKLSTLPQIQSHMSAATGFLGALSELDYFWQLVAFYQLMLFIAAWCIFIGGPGAVSLDRLIFRGGHNEED